MYRGVFLDLHQHPRHCRSGALSSPPESPETLARLKAFSARLLKELVLGPCPVQARLHACLGDLGVVVKAPGGSLSTVEW